MIHRRTPGRARGPVAGLALLTALLGAAPLLGCGSAESKLDTAAALRHAGKPREALSAYQALLAALGQEPLPAERAAVRVKALRAAGDLSYLELGDYAGAVAYYRRIISLAPGTPEALQARAVIGDIFRDRFQDRLAAIAQWADIAASEAPQAPQYQLKIAREYLELGNRTQARTEARLLRERWPTSREADEAQLLTGQAWALEKKQEEALGAFQALIERGAAPDVVARALEGQAHIHAQLDHFDRALELYLLALPNHPNPEAIRTNVEAVRRRKEAAKTATPGDRDQAFDYGKQQSTTREVTP